MAKEKEYVVGTVSKWDGGLLSLIGTFLLMFLVIGIMAGIGVAIAFAIGAFAEGAAPAMLAIGIAAIVLFAWLGFCWSMIIFIKWDTKHTVISGQRMQFKVGTLNLFFNMIKWTVLTVITVGIYGLWLPVKIRKWQVKNTVSHPEEDEYGYGAPEINYYEYDDEE